MNILSLEEKNYACCKVNQEHRGKVKSFALVLETIDSCYMSHDEKDYITVPLFIE